MTKAASKKPKEIEERVIQCPDCKTRFRVPVDSAITRTCPICGVESMHKMVPNVDPRKFKRPYPQTK